ncbi:unnamed protein product, partial [Allacma fusca]
HRDCVRTDDSVYTLIRKTNNKIHTTREYATSFHYSQAVDLKDAVQTLVDISNGPKTWINVILLQEKLTPIKILELKHLIQNQSEILGKHLNIISLVFIIEFFDIPVCDGCQDAAALDIYAIGGAVRVENYRVELPLCKRKLTLVYLRRNFHGISLKTAAMPPNEKLPHRVTYVVQNNKPKIQGGFEGQIIKFLARALNFTIVPVKGTGYLGSPFDGPPGGMAQQVENNEADICIESTEILSERQEFVTFLMPTYESPLLAFVVKESNNALRNVFLKAFDSNTWTLLFVTWVTLGLSLVIMTWLEKKLHSTRDLRCGSDQEFSEMAFLWGLGVFCQQGCHICPNSVPMRIIMLSGQLIGVVCYIAFGAALVSILSADEALIKSEGDLVQYGYKFYSDAGTFSATRAAKVLQRRPINEALNRETAVSTETAFGTTLKKHAAFLGLKDIIHPIFRVLLQDSITLESKIDDKICNTYMDLRITWNPIKCGMFVRKDSALQTYFNQKIILMIERGFRHRNFGYYYQKSTVRCAVQYNKFEPLEFRDVWSSFLLLLVGFIPSLLLLVLEKLHFAMVGIILNV